MTKNKREVEVEDDDLEDGAPGTGGANTEVIADDEDANEFDDGPDNAAARKEAAAEERRAKSRRSDDELDDEQDRRLAYDDIDDEDGGTSSRRRRRNRSRREARNASQSLIAEQAARIAKLEGAMAEVGRSQIGLAAGDIDGEIARVQGYLERIDGAMGLAMREQNDVEFRRALRLRDEANARLSDLSMRRQHLAAMAQQQTQQQMQPRTQPQVEVDPVAERFSDRFMDRHPWFDPTDTSHEDSQIVKAIDDTLVNEGFKPNTRRYWMELERRVEARGLGDAPEGDGMEDDDYRDQPRRKEKNSGGLPPRSRRSGGSGRKSDDGYDDRRLPAMARETLDQLGLLEKKGLSADQLKERAHYIKTWRAGLKDAARAA